MAAFFTIAGPLVVFACSLDESHGPIIVGNKGGAAGTASVLAGTAGSSTSGTGGAATTSSTTGGAGTGGAATTGGAGTTGAGGSAGNGGAGGAAGGDAGSAGMGGAGGDDMDAGMGGMGGGAPPVKNPTGIAVNGETATNLVGNSGGGGTFYQLCNGAGVLVGFPDATMDSSDASGHPWLLSTDAQCASLSLSGAGPFTVTITPAGTLGPLGKASDLMQASSCPSDQVMVGFTGNSGDYIDSLAPICAPLTVTGDSTTGYAITIGQPTVVTQRIGGVGGGLFGEIYCGPGQVVRGWTGFSGDWFDKFGVVCGDLSLSGTRR